MEVSNPIDLRNFFKKEEEVGVSNYLDEDLIVFLKAKDREHALASLVDILEKKGKLKGKKAFITAIMQREKVVTTGIGLQVAIPHAKLPGYDDFFIAIGIQKTEPGLEWNALDALPVRLIFMIGGPENRQTDYLKILSSLTRAIKDVSRRKALLAASTPSQILQQFKNC